MHRPASGRLRTSRISRSNRPRARSSSRYENGWTKLYSDDLSDEQKKKIEDALKARLRRPVSSRRRRGASASRIADAITYSALGQQAPLEAKEKWDPDFAKRKAIQAVLAKSLPEFSVRLGGTTSIDVIATRRSTSLRHSKLQEVLGIPIAQMLFIGDAIFPGGNDYPALEAGTDTIEVRDPTETKTRYSGHHRLR